MKELQRRLDQTLGKPGSYHHGMDREGHIKPMTIGARLYRLENQVNIFSLVNIPFIEISANNKGYDYVIFRTFNFRWRIFRLDMLIES